jgi:hypothetical protein
VLRETPDPQKRDKTDTLRLRSGFAIHQVDLRLTIKGTAQIEPVRRRECLTGGSGLTPKRIPCAKDSMRRGHDPEFVRSGVLGTDAVAATTGVLSADGRATVTSRPPPG